MGEARAGIYDDQPPPPLHKNFFCVAQPCTPSLQNLKKFLLVIPIHPMGSLISDVSERRTPAGSGLSAFLSRDFKQIFGQIVSLRVKNLVASRHIKSFKGSLTFDVRCLKTAVV